jgi:poly(3-hydroxybutyrate) depolymerase
MLGFEDCFCLVHLHGSAVNGALMALAKAGDHAVAARAPFVVPSS